MIYNFQELPQLIDQYAASLVPAMVVILSIYLVFKLMKAVMP